MLLFEKVKEIIKDEYQDGIGKFYSETLTDEDLEEFFGNCALRISLWVLNKNGLKAIKGQAELEPPHTDGYNPNENH